MPRHRDLPTRLVLLGDPVAHSLSPVFQNAALIAEGLPQRYSAMQVNASALPGVLRELVASRAAGNVTVPHKEAVHDLCDDRRPDAQRAGAVNTFWVDDGRLVGDNTDIAGAVRAIEHVVRGGALEQVIVFGAGGSAAAVLIALEQLGASSVHIVTRTATRAHMLIERLALRNTLVVEQSTDTFHDIAAASRLLVNTTPTGLLDDDQPVALSQVSGTAGVLDLVYRKTGTTPWVAAAQARNMRAVDGRLMLLEQGAAAFERWFDRPAPREVMWQALHAAGST